MNKQAKSKTEKKMSFINLTEHTVHIYEEDDFVELKQTNPTSWVANGIKEGAKPIIAVEPSGHIARISVKTEEMGVKFGVPFVKSVYGDLVGMPEDIKDDDILIVSLPTKSNALATGNKYASQMVCPYKVVRDVKNTSNILGAMKLTY